MSQQANCTLRYLYQPSQAFESTAELRRFLTSQARYVLAFHGNLAFLKGVGELRLPVRPLTVLGWAFLFVHLMFSACCMVSAEWPLRLWLAVDGVTATATVVERDSVTNNDGTDHYLTYLFSLPDERETVVRRRVEVSQRIHDRSIVGTRLTVTYAASNPGLALIGSRPLSAQDPMRLYMYYEWILFVTGCLVGLACLRAGRRENRRLTQDGQWIVGSVVCARRFTQTTDDGTDVEYIRIKVAFSNPSGRVIQRSVTRSVKCIHVAGGRDARIGPETRVIVRYVNDRLFCLL